MWLVCKYICQPKKNIIMFRIMQTALHWLQCDSATGIEDSYHAIKIPVTAKHREMIHTMPAPWWGSANTFKGTPLEDLEKRDTTLLRGINFLRIAWVWIPVTEGRGFPWISHSEKGPSICNLWLNLKRKQALHSMFEAWSLSGRVLWVIPWATKWGVIKDIALRAVGSFGNTYTALDTLWQSNVTMKNPRSNRGKPSS